jgi:hypothetical protein
VSFEVNALGAQGGVPRRIARRSSGEFQPGSFYALYALGRFKA